VYKKFDGCLCPIAKKAKVDKHCSLGSQWKKIQFCWAKEENTEARDLTPILMDSMQYED
jgi:hypothetical protein